jgi:hypothetical protein
MVFSINDSHIDNVEWRNEFLIYFSFQYSINFSHRLFSYSIYFLFVLWLSNYLEKKIDIDDIHHVLFEVLQKYAGVRAVD